MKRFSVLLVLSAVLATILAASAPALGPVDQSQPYRDGTLVLPPGVAQTFAAGRTGRLDGFTLTSPSGAPMFLQVYPVRADGTPDVSHPLLQQNRTIALRPGVATKIAIPPIAVKAGTKLALALGTIRSRATADLAVGAGDRYPAGQLYQAVGSVFKPVAGADLTFATHVSP